MDDLLINFLSEVVDGLSDLDSALINLEENPNDPKLIDNIFRVMHTIKGTSGFFDFPRLQRLTHNAENLVDLYRSGAVVTSDGVTIILAALDGVKELIKGIEGSGGEEPAGNDSMLVDMIEDMVAAVKLANPAKGRAEPAVNASSSVATPVAVADVVDDMNQDDFWDDEPKPSEKPPVAKHEVELPTGIAALSASKDKKAKKPPTASIQTVRVSVSLLDNLMDLAGELVLTRNQILQASRRQPAADFNEPIRNLSHVASELQETIMRTRMQPIGAAFNVFPRIVRDLSQQLNKKIKLTTSGEETEIDRQVLEMIRDPLTHMVRNCADHAIETPEERLAAGKPEFGEVKLEALHEGGHIVIRIQDDGRGISVDRVARKALEKGLVTAEKLKEMSPNRIRSLVFGAGFSTAETVTEVSGRGVGMDVVRSNIEKIGGTITLDSEEGVGTTFTIMIPLTLAILSAFICGVGNSRFAVPQMVVHEIVNIEKASDSYSIETVKNTQLLRLRGKLHPLINLANCLSIDSKVSNAILVCQVGTETFGIVVDDVIEVQEIVVKPLSKALKKISIYSGNTILGDGSSVLIIEPNGLFSEFGEPSQKVADEHVDPVRDEVVSDIVKMVVFRAGSGPLKAVHMSVVSRLEEFDTSAIITGTDGTHLVRYRESLMPILYTNGYEINTAPNGMQKVIVFTDAGRSMGLAVDEIVGVPDTSVILDIASDLDGLIGSAVINGSAVEIIDISYYLDRALGNWFNPATSEIYAPGLKVLIVDDSQFFRNVFYSSLSSRGFEVDTAVDPEDALKKLSAEHYDVLVSDIEMPGMTGLELISYIRSNGPHKDIAAIAVSAHGADEDKEAGMRAGFNAYLSKTDRDSIFEFLFDIVKRKNDARKK